MLIGQRTWMNVSKQQAICLLYMVEQFHGYQKDNPQLLYHPPMRNIWLPLQLFKNQFGLKIYSRKCLHHMLIQLLSFVVTKERFRSWIIIPIVVKQSISISKSNSYANIWRITASELTNDGYACGYFNQRCSWIKNNWSFREFRNWIMHM